MDYFDHEIYKQIMESTYVSHNESVGRPMVAVNAGVDEDHDGTKVHRPIVTYGNFAFIAAPPKTMKTFYTTLLTASYLGNMEHTGLLDGVDRRGGVVHFDTEQGKYHCARVQARVKYMCPTSYKDYRMFALRAIDVPTRIAYIGAYLKENYENIGLVIVDGIADLLYDNNNIEESNKVVQKLMTWSADYNVAIVTVIHTNWGSNKPTGHIGSFLEKKAETQIGLERDGDNGSGTPIIKVSCRQSRNRPFEEHWFTVNKGIPEVLTNEFDD